MLCHPTLSQHFYSTTRPQPWRSGAQLLEFLAFQSLQHVAWPSPVSSLSMASSHRTPPSFPHTPPLSNSLTSFRVRRQGPKSVRCKRAALRLLDGLARDVPQPARKEGYIKIATIVKDTADACTPWMAELLVAILTTTTNLVGSNSCHLSLFTIRLAVLCALDVNAHLFLATDIFLKRPPSRRYGTEECKEGCVDGLLWVGNLCGAELCSDIWSSKK